MTTSELSNLSVLKAFIDDKENTLHSILPFVEHVIAEFDREWIDFPDLKDRLKTSCLLDVPHTTLRSLLNILKRNGYVKGYDDWSKIQVVNNPKHITQEYQEKFQNANRNTVAFLRSCIQYCQFNITEAEMSETLYLFLNTYQHKIDISNGLIDIENSPSPDEPNCCHEKYTIIANYISEISKSDAQNFAAFKNIFSGFLLSQFIRHNKITERKEIVNLRIYIDSNFILRILDLQAPPYVEASRELLKLLEEHKMTLLTLPEIVEEVKQSITRQFKRYENDKDYYNAIYGDQDINCVDEIIGAFYRRNLQTTQILELIDNIENTLKSFGVVVQYQALPPNNARGWSDSELQAIVRNKLSRAKLDILNSQLSPSQQYQHDMIRRRAELDEAILTFIRHQRNYRNATRIDQCRVLFLTCDNTLYRANNYNHKRNGTISECLNETTFTNTLYMHNPGLNQNASIKSLIAIFQSSSFLKYDFIQRFHAGLAAHMEREPDDKQYLAYIFHNQAMFNEMTTQQEEDDVAPLISSLLAEAKAEKDAEIVAGNAAIQERPKLLENIKRLTDNLSMSQMHESALEDLQAENAELKNNLAQKEQIIECSKSEHQKELSDLQDEHNKRIKRIVRCVFWCILGVLLVLTTYFSLTHIFPTTPPYNREFWISTGMQALSPILLLIIAVVIFRNKYLEDALDCLINKKKEKNIVRLIVSLVLDIVIVLANIFFPLLIN